MGTGLVHDEGSSEELLRSLGYEVEVSEEPGEEPEQVPVTFAELVPCLSGDPIGRQRLYRHQLDSLKLLEEGRNIVLTAKTGSGKTEAWVLPALRKRWRVLAVYPTLALSLDQIRRLERYYSVCGYDEGSVLRIDRPSLRGGRASLEAKVSKAMVVVTNPAFLLAELKRMAVGSGRSLLAGFLEKVDMIVIDELDFYSPRSAHLLLAMVDILANYVASKRPAVVALSATLGNPQELASLLSKINGRPTSVLEGKPFKAPNKVIVVLGKGAGHLKRFILENRSVIESKARWILDYLKSESKFREHIFEIYEALEALGLRPPRLWLDAAEIVAALASRDPSRGVTLVFTRSIAAAERIYKSVIEALGERGSRLVAVHHHLVPKDKREKIEEAARKGEVKVIVTVRTLAQGIDIGTIKRVVHIGLPFDVREYMQREGRKGRRREIQLTESIVIPSGMWDRKLLEAGVSALKSWLKLPLEKLYINMDNAYMRLFVALWKLLRGLEPNRDEARLLAKYGLVERVPTLEGQGYRLSKRGKSFWTKLSFYEYGLPYGLRKVLVSRGRQHLLDDEVSLREAVERFQPGTYDVSTDTLVVELDTKSLRIYESRPAEAVASHEWLSRAASLYESLKRSWRERPSLEDDLRYGRLQTLVVLNVKPPRKGFGVMVEEPVAVKWIVESRRPRLSESPKAQVKVHREIASIVVDAPVSGRYVDFTYGRVFEAPSHLSSDDIRVGMVFLLLFLRMHPDYAIPLGALRYAVTQLGPLKLIHLWESEAIGLVDKLSWLEVRRKLQEYTFPALAIPLASALDVNVGLKLLRGEVSLSEAKDAALAVLDAISGTVYIESQGVRLSYPRPDPSYGIAALALLSEEVRSDDAQVSVVAVASYDGSRKKVEVYSGNVSLETWYSVSQLLLRHVDELMALPGGRRLKIYVYGGEQIGLLKRLVSLSYAGSLLLKSLEREGVIIDLEQRLKTMCRGYAGSALLTGAVEPKLRDYAEWVAKAKSRRDVEELKVAVRAAAETLAEAVYKLALAAELGIVSCPGQSNGEAEQQHLR
ncbi:MAG: DEAD/DEAH box helicase [Thermoproteota archaeon]